MALFSVSPETMRPASLTLNIFVATIGTIRFYRAGCFSWSILLPFALASVPAAFIGGWLTLPGRAYKIIVGIVLLMAAARFVWNRSPIRPSQFLFPWRYFAGRLSAFFLA
jgi:uncharacterized membrane protein YfcA